MFDSTWPMNIVGRALISYWPFLVLFNVRRCSSKNGSLKKHCFKFQKNREILNFEESMKDWRNSIAILEYTMAEEVSCMDLVSNPQYRQEYTWFYVYRYDTMVAYVLLIGSIDKTVRCE